MNAQELFVMRDGTPVAAGVWYCQTCRIVHRNTADADRCCAPWACERCGAAVDRYVTECNACTQKRLALKEVERFEKASKSTDAEGPYFCEGVGFEFFADIEELEDALEFEDFRPVYVWCCTTPQIVDVDVDRILEQIADDTYDGFDPAELDGIDELRAAVERFNQQNKDETQWEPDYTRARLLGPAP